MEFLFLRIAGMLLGLMVVALAYWDIRRNREELTTEERWLGALILAVVVVNPWLV